MKVQKKKSKRLPLRQKYKVERKVREHNRKIRKEARLNPKGQRKKDPGIPNLWPFKEQMLERIKAQQEREQDNKERKKEQKKQAQAQSIKELMKDAQKRQKAFEEKEKTLLNVKDLDFNRLPENSKRAYYKEFKKVVEAADVILEVLDARDPLGTRARAVEQMISSQPNKKIILVLNKIDLVPREIAQEWLKYLRNEFPTIAFKCCTSTQRANLGQSHAAQNSTATLSSNECLGAHTLVQLLKNYSRSADIKTAISVGIIGYPNVGKSSLINSLNRSKAVGVGATPGFTKVMQEVQLDKKVKLLDCPGIVFASGAEQDQGEIALRNCVRVEKIEDPVKPIEAILRRCKPVQLVSKYKIPLYSSAHEFLAHVARRRGKLLKGGVPDYVDAARIVLHDWNSGFLPYYTAPPAPDQNKALQNVQHETAQIVAQFGKEFDLDALLRDADHADLNRIPSIAAATEDHFVELDATGASLDQLFTNMLSLSDQHDLDDDKSDLSMDEEETDDDGANDDEDAEDDEDQMEDVDEVIPPMLQRVPVAKPVKKQVDEEDRYNPQHNQNLRRQLKKQKKAAKKTKSSRMVEESFDFASDFVADNDVSGNVDVDDDDLINL